jgi:hypothetical protein
VRADAGTGDLALVYRQHHQNLPWELHPGRQDNAAQSSYIATGSPSNPWWADLEREVPAAVEAGPPAVGYLASTRLIPLWAAAEVLTTNNRRQDRRHNGRQFPHARRSGDGCATSPRALADHSWRFGRRLQ